MKLLDRPSHVRTILDTLYLINYSNILNEGIDSFTIIRTLSEDRVYTRACVYKEYFFIL